MKADPMQSSVTRILQDVEGGDTEAFKRLFSLMYETLHERAHWQRNNWHGDLTLNTTALVHEAYVKLVDQKADGWESRSHFMGVAAKAIRHILVDYARRRRAERRGGHVQKLSLEAFRDENRAVVMDEGRMEMLLDLDAALKHLDAVSPREARVVECRFFGAMSVEETATALSLSGRTVKRDWAMARAWLYRALADKDGSRRCDE